MDSRWAEAAIRIVDTDPAGAFRLTVDGIRASADSSIINSRLSDRHLAPRPDDVRALIHLAESVGHQLDRILAHADDDRFDRR